MRIPRFVLCSCGEVACGRRSSGQEFECAATPGGWPRGPRSKGVAVTHHMRSRPRWAETSSSASPRHRDATTSIARRSWSVPLVPSIRHAADGWLCVSQTAAGVQPFHRQGGRLWPRGPHGAAIESSEGLHGVGLATTDQAFEHDLVGPRHRAVAVEVDDCGVHRVQVGDGDDAVGVEVAGAGRTCLGPATDSALSRPWARTQASESHASRSGGSSSVRVR